jgi:hypothetical protein
MKGDDYADIKQYWIISSKSGFGYAMAQYPDRKYTFFFGT